MNDTLQYYLDEIDNSYLVSECDVLSSLSDEYDKSVLILEYYQGNDLSSFQLFVMESETEKQSDEEDNRSIWQKAAGDKNEHIILRILQYIPRLLKEFWKWLTKEKSDSNKKEGTSRGFKSLEERINACKSEADFEQIESELNEGKGENDPQIMIDRKTKQIAFKTHKGFIETSDDLLALYEQLLKIKEHIEQRPDDFKSILNEINDIKAGDKKMSFTPIALSIEAVAKSMSDADDLGNNFANIIATIGSYCEGQQQRAEELGEDDELMTALTNVSKKLLAIQNTVQNWLGPVRNITNRIYRWFNFGKEIHKSTEGASASNIVNAAMGSLAMKSHQDLIFTKFIINKGFKDNNNVNPESFITSKIGSSDAIENSFPDFSSSGEITITERTIRISEFNSYFKTLVENAVGYVSANIVKAIEAGKSSKQEHDEIMKALSANINSCMSSFSKNMNNSNLLIKLFNCRCWVFIVKIAIELMKLNDEELNTGYTNYKSYAEKYSAEAAYYLRLKEFYNQHGERNGIQSYDQYHETNAYHDPSVYNKQYAGYVFAKCRNIIENESENEPLYSFSNMITDFDIDEKSLDINYSTTNYNSAEYNGFTKPNDWSDARYKNFVNEKIESYVSSMKYANTYDPTTDESKKEKTRYEKQAQYTNIKARQNTAKGSYDARHGL